MKNAQYLVQIGGYKTSGAIEIASLRASKGLFFFNKLENFKKMGVKCLFLLYWPLSFCITVAL